MGKYSIGVCPLKTTILVYESIHSPSSTLTFSLGSGDIYHSCYIVVSSHIISSRLQWMNSKRPIISQASFIVDSHLHQLPTLLSQPFRELKQQRQRLPKSQRAPVWEACFVLVLATQEAVSTGILLQACI